eukprot:3064033-Pyramimonas_sp.AAC.1
MVWFANVEGSRMGGPRSRAITVGNFCLACRGGGPGDTPCRAIGYSMPLRFAGWEAGKNSAEISYPPF